MRKDDTLIITLPLRAAEQSPLAVTVEPGITSITITLAEAQQGHVVLTLPDTECAVIVSTDVPANADLTVTSLLMPATDAQRNVARKGTVAKDARLCWNEALFGGTAATSSLQTDLVGEGAECISRTVFFGAGKEHITADVTVNHLADRTRSRLWCDGALNDAAKASYRGLTHVRTGTVGCDADQREHVLLLSPNAGMQTDPILEIGAEDVKCGHGASIRKPDPERLFFLCSRGLSTKTALAMTVQGFFAANVARFNAAEDAILTAVASRIQTL